MKKMIIAVMLILFFCTEGWATLPKRSKRADDRTIWVELIYKIAAPVLENMSKGELQKKMQVEVSPTWDGRDVRVTYMECFGRLMAGIAPWLSLPDEDTPEGLKRRQLREWALAAYAHAVDPESPDYLLWRHEGQPLVDAAYIAESFLRAPAQLWEPLDSLTKSRYIEEFKGLRRVSPPYTNWLLFAAIDEAFLHSIGEEYDPVRLGLAVRKFEEWYVGDGWYGDGETFHYDYYNSYVIHAMQLECMDVLVKHGGVFWGGLTEKFSKNALKRMQRYAEHLERLISPAGTYPPVGRSLTYRTAVFQPLSLLAWREQLPESLSLGQVRAALTAVHQMVLSDPSNFNEGGYLTIGFVGHHPALGDWYSNNGSMYITSLSFAALGLPADHPFWTSPAEDWTQKKAFAGEDFPKDYHVDY